MVEVGTVTTNCEVTLECHCTTQILTVCLKYYVSPCTSVLLGEL